MAIWRVENSMLTLRGIEILNKVKAGIGTIKVTRVVAGSGRVPESQLYSLLSVSGDIKPMVLSQSDSKDTGSELSVYIINDGYTEPFIMQQIGIYVTHPDYEGEQLYHISQCDEGNYDIIPALDETPVTFGYSIFLEHGNSNSIEIIVDPAGMMTVKKFDEFRNNIVSGNIVEADEMGNLKDTGRQSSSIPNPNLIHNWYFINPVNRKNGYYAVRGTTYYSDKSLTTVAGTLSSNSMVTYLNNVCGFFIRSNVAYYVPISNMVKGYVGTQFSIDRWNNSINPIQLDLTQNGVRMRQPESSSVNNYLVQDIDRFDVADGREVTLSVLLSNGSLYSSTGIVPVSPTENKEVAKVTIDTATYVECYRRNDNRLAVQFRMSVGSDITVVAVKLEFGSAQTLAHKDSNGKWVLSEVPSFSDEMVKCTQYSLVNGSYLGYNPYGYVEESIANVQSAEDLDARLTSIFDNMVDGTIKFARATFSTGHPVLGGGDRLVEIFRANNNYGFVRATSYSNNSNGVILEHSRSYANKVWTDWARTYNTYNKPTLTELGAAPSGYGLGAKNVVRSTDVNILNTLTESGWYSVEFGVATTLATGYTGSYLQVRVDAYEPTHLVQTAKFTNSTSIVQRSRLAGTWSEWAWVNPPMSTNVEYRTTERYQGADVFKKVDSNGNILWRKEGSDKWLLLSSVSQVVPASLE